jgi:hypothetical protein
VDLQRRVDVDADLVEQLLDDLEVVAFVHLADGGEHLDLEGRHAGAHDALPVVRLVGDGRGVQFLQQLLGAAPNLDELVDQVEVLDDERSPWMLQVVAPRPGWTTAVFSGVVTRT